MPVIFNSPAQLRWVVIVSLLMSYSWLEAQEPTIIYIGDPMCSWCYGFAPEIEKVKEALPNHAFEVVLGGLRPNGTETMADLGEFLKHHWQEVHERSGQPFNYSIIGNENFILDTEPGSRAVVAARTMDSTISLSFFKAVQHAFFVENKDMRAESTFTRIAQDFGLDTVQFKQLFNQEEIKYETNNDFQLASEMGIRGSPSAVIRHNGQLYLAANGYRTAEDLLKTIEQIRKE